MGAPMRRLALCSTVFAISMAASASGAGWKRTDLRPVTQPAPVGSVLVLYAAEGGGLSLTALDAATGATVWSVDASTSEIPPGVAPLPVIAGANVIYLARRIDGSTALTAADARTGAPVWQTQGGSFDDVPTLCGDDESAVCLSGFLGAGFNSVRSLRFDAATGQRRPAPRVPGPGPREIGTGLLDAGARHPERLVGTRAGKVAWNRVLSRIFPLPGASTDYGWNFERLDRLGLFVGSVGTKPRERGGRFTADLARTAVAGFRIADGVVRWRSRGQYECVYLPCPGSSQSGYQAMGAPSAETTVGLRLIAQGRISGRQTTTDVDLSADARATLEGFAPATGRARWRFDAGHNVGLIEGRLIPAQTGPHTIVLRAAGGRVVALDLATGERRAVAASAVGWCRRIVIYHLDDGYDVGGTTHHQYVGQYALGPCAARSQGPTPTPAAAPAFVGDIGARSAGLLAWSANDGVFAAPPSS
jgi:PQQ-like domain